MDGPKLEKNLETKVIETWSTLDYRADKWGPERIVFDAISNHFPEDCGGTWYLIEFVQGDIRVDLRHYDPSKPVDEIYFWDDGKGYDYIYTVLHYSSKKDRETQMGRFGEGIKMISAAALRHNVNLEFGSQDWVVRPTVKKRHLEQENREVDLLSQEITTGHEMMQGSYTCIRNPSEEIIRHICSFTERLINFREDLCFQEKKGLHSKHRIFLPKKLFTGELFVKKIKYPAPANEKLYLSYQINGLEADSLLSPDRDQIYSYNLSCILKDIILRLNETELIAPLLIPTTPECMEKRVYVNDFDQVTHPELWRRVFYQLYGAKAVLAEQSKPTVNENAKAQGFTVVGGIPGGIYNILCLSGIKKVSEVSNRKLTYDTVPIDSLPAEQKVLFGFHREIDTILFGAPLDADVYVFSRAFDENGDATWFRGMSYFDFEGKTKAKIYIRADQLHDQQKFLAAYGHEAVHVYTKSVDMSKEFENGLTEALGTALEAYRKRTKQ